MFLRKRQAVSGYVSPAMPMMTATTPEGMMMGPGAAEMAGMPYRPDVAGYAEPGFMHVGMPDMCCPPPCPPYDHLEAALEVEPYRMPHVHIVRKGETVYKIAQRYGLDWRELAGYNHLGNPNLIYPGQRLEIPPR